MKLEKETNLSQAAHGRCMKTPARLPSPVIGRRTLEHADCSRTYARSRRFSDIRAELPGLKRQVLTERLARLEELGVLIVTSYRPASVQVFELTDWGRELRIRHAGAGRWAVRSPLHDASLPMTATSFLLSCAPPVDLEKAGASTCAILFRTPAGETMSAKVVNGELAVARHAIPVCAGFRVCCAGCRPILAVIGKQEPGVAASPLPAMSPVTTLRRLVCLAGKVPLPGGTTSS